MKLLKRLLPVFLVAALILPGVSPAYADTVYTVQTGDTLNKIAVKFNVSISAIMTANNLTNPNFLYVGQRLTIPGVSGASAPAAATTYVVQSGDSLSKVARQFNISLAALMAANGITNANFIYVGQRLSIPGASGNPAPATAAPTVTVLPASSGGTYVVQSRDTLLKIAQKFGVTYQTLLAANHITNPNLIYEGQRLVIPGGVSATITPTTPATAQPTATLAPTAIVPTSTPVLSGYSSRGIHGDSFSIATTGRINAQVWFDFQVTNTTDNDVSYGMLSAHTDVGPTGKSWSGATLRAHETLTWHDHMQFSSAGTYQVYMGICYDAPSTCSSGSRTWDRLSNSIAVTVY